MGSRLRGNDFVGRLQVDYINESVRTEWIERGEVLEAFGVIA